MAQQTDLLSEIPATDSNVALIATWSVERLRKLPARLADHEMAMLAELSASPERSQEPGEHDHFLKVMRALSILPRKADDDVSGELRSKLYWAKLRHLPNDALSHLADKGIERRWFPTIAECLEIIGDWTSQAKQDGFVRSKATALIEHERQARYLDAMKALKFGELDHPEIDALDDFTKQAGETAAYLRRWPDGTFTRRTPRDSDPEGCALAEAERCRAAWESHDAEQAA